MNSTPDNPLPSGTASEPAPYDVTLRLIACPPVPAGLKERVHASLLKAVPRPAAHARILTWPAQNELSAFWSGSGWMRAAAAAAIVFVVAGGGWGVYQRVERSPAKVFVIPGAQSAGNGSFSSAGAIRTPQTVKGPVLVKPVVKDRGKKPARKKTSMRTAGPGAAAQPVSAAGSK